jgi:hypothetical protein
MATMNRPIIFVDCETTGLEPDADIWEFAGIRSNPDGASEQLHLFIKHSRAECSQLPESFLADHRARFPHHPNSRREAANKICAFLGQRDGEGKPIWIGSAPDFDAQRVGRLIRRHANRRSEWVSSPLGGHQEWYPRQPEWDHQLVGVVPLMLGYLAAKGEPIPEHRSEALSRAIGVDPDQFERHTALGDVLWTVAIYDRVMGVDHV